MTPSSEVPVDPDRGSDEVGGPRTARRVAGGVGGLLVGLLAGAVVTIAFVVARAALLKVYFHSFEETIGWPAVPLVLLVLAGVALGLAGRLGRLAIGAAVGAGLGAGLGALFGSAVTADSTGPWAGGVIGAGAGVLLGGVLAALAPGSRIGGRVVSARHRLPLSGAQVVGAAVVVVALTGVALASLARSEAPSALPAAGAVPPPDTSSVEAVVIFVGDAGEATLLTHPVVARLRDDVEAWSRALGPEGEVVVVYLGDIVYPYGLSAPDAPARARDSTRIDAQVAVVGGPEARRIGARGVFVMGNHDWGERQDWEGAVRVIRLGEFIDRRRAEGLRVSVEPPPSTGGPSVLDVGTHLRLLFLDTAWWLLDAEREAKDRVIAGVEGALESAGARKVALAAHHPFESGGSHGALTALGSTLGLRFILSRSGARLQDLYSAPYRELRNDLQDVFRRTGPPVLFAGGHDHSLQVVRASDPDAPGTSLVSGSGSKLSGVGIVSGTRFAGSLPGYATVLVHRDGTLRLRVDATPARYQSCPEAGSDPEGQALSSAAAGGDCMTEGVAAFRTVWAGPI
jgi:hypothetical protein